MMTPITAVLDHLHLDRATVDVWVAQGWVRPRLQAGEPVWEPIDVARLHLIVDLREGLALGDEAVPVVLSLIDQLHATRAQKRRVREAMETSPEARAGEVLRRLLGG